MQISSNGFLNESKTSRSVLLCPLPDDSDDITRRSILSVDARVLDGHQTSSVMAQACVKYSRASGGTCSSYEYSGGSTTGYVILSPDVSKLRNESSSHYGYLRINSPARYSSSDQSGVVSLSGQQGVVTLDDGPYSGLIGYSVTNELPTLLPFAP